ncbi:hypothetical protein GCM10020295_34420 [Streptomyces cinereospinus]
MMVKPAGPYLDILARVADAVDVPVAAYQISGEYSMIEAAAEKGWIDRDRAILETLTGIKRAARATSSPTGPPKWPRSWSRVRRGGPRRVLTAGRTADRPRCGPVPGRLGF